MKCIVNKDKNIFAKKDENDNTIRDIMFNNLLRETNNYIDYLRLLSMVENKLVIIAVKDTSGLSYPKMADKYTEKLNIKTKLSSTHWRGFVAVILNKGCIYEQLGEVNEGVVYKDDIDESTSLCVESFPYNVGNRAGISINGINYSMNLRGLNVVVYDINDGLVDSVNFDLHVRNAPSVRNQDVVVKNIESRLAASELTDKKMEYMLWGLAGIHSDSREGKKALFRNLPCASGTLALIQRVNLITLVEFDNICKENDIEYWLSFGALIGAVRHEGFIPWDDDVDVCVMREELEKIKSAFENHPFLAYKSFVDSTGINICYKIQYKYPKVACDLDIFILDYCNDDVEFIKKKNMEIKLKMMNEISNKSKTILNKEEIIDKYRLFSKEKINYCSKTDANSVVWDLENVFTAQGQASTTYLTDLFPLSKVKIGRFAFSAPGNPVRYLNILYGDIYSFPKDLERRHFDSNIINKESLLQIIKEHGEGIDI